MFVNIGSSKNVRIKNILGVFDIDSTTVSAITRKYLADAEKHGEMSSTCLIDIPKSFVVYRDNRRTDVSSRASDGSHPTRICLSKFSPSALAKRLGDSAEAGGYSELTEKTYKKRI